MKAQDCKLVTSILKRFSANVLFEAVSDNEKQDGFIVWNNDPDTSSFTRTEIITIMEALNFNVYLRFNKVLDKIVLRIF